MNTQVRAQDRTENHELTEEARRRSEECCGVTYLAEEGPSEGASVARAPCSVLPPSRARPPQASWHHLPVESSEALEPLLAAITMSALH